MSYLPRMSETYKEPRSNNLNAEFEGIDSTLKFKNLKPASAILSEKYMNAQTTLKHYRYLPHALPTLPGPSVLDEAIENENQMEKYKSKRGSATQSNTESSTDSGQVNMMKNNSETSHLDESEDEKDVVKLKEHTLSSSKRQQYKKANKSTKSINKKKSSSKNLLFKKQSSKKLDHVTVNLCLDRPKDFAQAISDRKSDLDELSEILDKCEALSKETSSIQTNSSKKSCNSMSTMKQTLQEVDKLKGKSKESKNRSVQCTIFGSSEKIFVIPPVINSLLQALAFLLHELNREDAITQGSNDRKRLMPQIQLILGDLCNQNTEGRFSFDTTFSDSKRVEKILYDLQKYIKDVYGSKEEENVKKEDLKKIFTELKKKDLELEILEDKMKETENLLFSDFEFKEQDFKNPEVTLQNKRLESEQLLAEIEFSSRELKNYQEILAESEWEIKLKHDEIVEVKKLRSSKSKMEVSGKKTSIQKFSAETLSKCRSKDRPDSAPKKKT